MVHGGGTPHGQEIDRHALSDTAGAARGRARGGELFVFAHSANRMRAGDGVHFIEVPATEDPITPIVYTVPLQFLAYHVAVLKGADVDQPRNLAKSVTVE